MIRALLTSVSASSVLSSVQLCGKNDTAKDKEREETEESYNMKEVNLHLQVLYDPGQ